MPFFSDDTSAPFDLSTVRVALIEDDILLSELLARALREQCHAKLLRVFDHGRPAVADCLQEPPDLLITDLTLPDMNGRDIIRLLRDRWPQLRVIVLTGQLDPALPGALLELGASGFVHKTSNFKEVETAIGRVMADGMYFSAGLSPARGRRPTSGTNGHRAAPTALTERERNIARLVANGMISKEIAAQLNLSPRTIEKERAKIFSKLGLRDLPSLVRWCVEHDLV